MVAVKNNSAKVVQLLVEQGQANQDVTDKFGKKAIDKATTLEIFELLKQINTNRIETGASTLRKNSASKSKNNNSGL